MGNRYWITGVQLGIVKGLLQSTNVEKGTKDCKILARIDELVDEVLEDQRIGDVEDLGKLLVEGSSKDIVRLFTSR